MSANASTAPDALEAHLEVLVQPRASRSELVGWHDGRLKVRLSAPPVDGAANEALVDLLADKLQVSRRDISIVRGATSRRKTLRVPAKALARLSAEAR